MLLTKIYEFVRNSPRLKGVARKLIGLAGGDVSYIGSYMGSAEKLLYQVIDGGRRNITMVTIGGGHFFKRGWGNLDYTGGRYNLIPGTVDWEHDLASFDLLPFENESIQYFYSSHCLEHIPEKYSQHIFNELHRCLRPCGAVHITVPDFDAGYEALCNNDTNFFDDLGNSSDIENSFIHYFVAGYLDGHFAAKEIRRWCENLSKDDFIASVATDVPEEWSRTKQDHVSWWNFDKMAAGLKYAGFHDIVRLPPQGSRFPEMRGSGMSWAFDHRNIKHSFFLEATKPGNDGNARHADAGTGGSLARE